jgi:hypothetical protein
MQSPYAKVARTSVRGFLGIVVNASNLLTIGAKQKVERK